MSYQVETYRDYRATGLSHPEALQLAKQEESKRTKARVKNAPTTPLREWRGRNWR